MNAESPLRLHCPKCSAVVKAAAKHAGKRLKCPRCGGIIKVPGAVATANDDDQWFNLDEDPPIDVPNVPGRRTVASQSSSRSEADSEARHNSRSESAAGGSGEPKGGASAASHNPAASHEALPTDWLDDLPPLDGPDLSGDLEDMGLPPMTEADLKTLESVVETPALVEPQTPQEYRAKCPVCESVHHVKPAQAGRELHCGDCHSTFVVPPPPKARPKAKIDIERAATFQLAEPVGQRSESTDPLRKSAAEYLQQAEDAGIEEDPARQYDAPDIRGWFRETFAIFADPTVGIHWLALSLIGAIPGMLFALSGNVFVFIPGIGLMLIAASLMLACGFAVLEANANGRPKVDEWPVFNPIEWLTDYFVVFVAFCLSAAPGVLIGSLFGMSMLSVGLVMFSIFVLFPFVFLSVLDNGSVLQPISSEVSKSVSRCTESWGTLYFSSMLLFIAQFFTYAFFAQFAPAVLTAFVDSFLTVGVVFIYFAMIGRLAFSIGQSVNAGSEEE